jgi:hypothetical protein
VADDRALADDCVVCDEECCAGTEEGGLELELVMLVQPARASAANVNVAATVTATLPRTCIRQYCTNSVLLDTTRPDMRVIGVSLIDGIRAQHQLLRTAKHRASDGPHECGCWHGQREGVVAPDLRAALEWQGALYGDKARTERRYSRPRSLHPGPMPIGPRSAPDP